jgi:hypothetical protein
MMWGLHVSQIELGEAWFYVVGELVNAAPDGVVPAPGGGRYGRFTVIDGDRE